MLNKLKTFKLIAKIRPFLVHRLAPVVAIWGALLIMFWLFSAVVQTSLSNLIVPIKASLNFDAVTGSQGMVAIGVGLLGFYGFLIVFRSNVTTNDSDHKLFDRIANRCMDEVSSAATHLASAKLCAAFVGLGVPFMVFQWPNADLYKQLALILSWAFLSYVMPADTPQKAP